MFSNPISVFIHIHTHKYKAIVLIWLFSQKIGVYMLYYRFVLFLTMSSLSFEIMNTLLKRRTIFSNQTSLLQMSDCSSTSDCLKWRWFRPLHQNTRGSCPHGLCYYTTGSSRALRGAASAVHVPSIRTLGGEIQYWERCWEWPPSTQNISPTSSRKGFESERSRWASLQGWSWHRAEFLPTFFGNFCPIKLFLCFFNFVWRK